MKKKIAVLLCAVMAAGTLSGCGGGQQTGANGTENIKLSVWPPEFAQNFPSGQQTDPVMKKIEETFHVTLDVETHPTDEKFNVLLASGSLPDLVQTGSKYVTRVLDSKNAVELDSLMEKNGQDIMKNAPKAVDFSKKMFSKDTGKLYFLPTQVGERSDASAIVGRFLRWDYYKELGYPEINTDEDWLNVVAQMQEKHPTNEAGETVYGFSPWFDWDLWPYYMGGAFLTDDTYQLSGLCQIDRNTNAVTSLVYEEDSILWQGAHLWFEANRKGLLDPDALTQKYETAIQKGSTNKVLASQAVWQTRDSNQVLKSAGYPDRGFTSMPIPPENPKYATSSKVYGDAGRMWFINKNCKAPERALQVLNHMYSIDGANMIVNGIEGVDFTVENGTRKLTDAFVQTKLDNPDWVGTTGATKYQNWCGLGTYFDYDKSKNEKLIISDRQQSIDTMTEMDKDFCKRYGVELPWDYADKEGNMVEDNTGLITSLLPEVPTDIKRIDDKIMTYLQSNLPKMILAGSEEEYNAIKQQLITEIKGMDYDTAFQYHSKAFEDAAEKVKELD